VAEGLGSLPRPPESELADPDALSTLLQGASDGLRALERPDGRDRLYLTRKSGRRLVNRPEMEQWFEEHGYEVLDFAELPFIEQVRRTRNAEFVIAETGSSVYGLLFARPGVRIGVVGRETEREHEWLNEMFLRLGHRLMLMACEVVEKHPITPDKENFRADLEQLPGFLDALAEMP
jgi:capsular polysaccharide biosynthesis protein